MPIKTFIAIMMLASLLSFFAGWGTGIYHAEQAYYDFIQAGMQ